MSRRPPNSQLTAPLFPYTTCFRSLHISASSSVLGRVSWNSSAKRRHKAAWCIVSSRLSSSNWAVGAQVQRHARSLATKSSILRSEEHTSELQSLMRISYAVFCLKKKNKTKHKKREDQVRDTI